MAALIAGMNTFVATGSIQTVTVATTGIYDIVAYGAQGGAAYNGRPGGLGAEIGGDVTLTAGETLEIAVGTQGKTGGGKGGLYTLVGAGGGGGGSFVIETYTGGGTPVDNPLIVAGGGGGAGDGYSGGAASGSNSAGGAGGSGGSSAYLFRAGGGGGGLYGPSGRGADQGGYGGKGLNDGLAGGSGAYENSFLLGHFRAGDGGFGGGGAGGSASGGGGGGAYGGSGGSYSAGPIAYGGKGGGSLDRGTNQVLIGGENVGNGEVVIDLVTPTCFATGTRIATVHGLVAVEALAIGERLITAKGDIRAIRWIGHRTIDCIAMSNPADFYPIRVRAGAFGRGLPVRDLLLTPGHHIYAEGILAPISSLENGVTIAREAVRHITYWHVELDSHDVILTEGLPTESYLDTGNRPGFDNYDGPIALHPAPLDPAVVLQIWATSACAPRADNGPRIHNLRWRLMEDSRALGITTTADAAIKLFADGRPLNGYWSDGCLNIAVPQWATTLRIHSRAGLPVWSNPGNDDKRCLGICVHDVLADGVPLAADGAAFCSGFHEVERDGDRIWRWTDGDARLNVAGVQRLKMRIDTLSAYPSNSDPAPYDALPVFRKAAA